MWYNILRASSVGCNRNTSWQRAQSHPVHHSGIAPSSPFRNRIHHSDLWLSLNTIFFSFFRQYQSFSHTDTIDCAQHRCHKTKFQVQNASSEGNWIISMEILTGHEILSVLAQTPKCKRQDCRLNRLNLRRWGDQNKNKKIIDEFPLNKNNNRKLVNFSSCQWSSLATSGQWSLTAKFDRVIQAIFSLVRWSDARSYPEL